MYNYLIRRCLLLPVTLFCIILVNFVIINLAPGEPVTLTEISSEGMAARKEGDTLAFGSDERYLFFREQFGLTLPVLINLWQWTSEDNVRDTLVTLTTRMPSVDNPLALSVKKYDSLRIAFGDKARFIMPELLAIIGDDRSPLALRKLAVHFFIRGAWRPPYVGPKLSPLQKSYNRKVASDRLYLKQQHFDEMEPNNEIATKVSALREWFAENRDYYQFTPSGWESLSQMLFETRFYRYMSRVLTLDFGTMRNDDNKTVIDEVLKRFKYSLTLAIIPMAITFILCQLFAFIMALNQQHWPDFFLNFIFLLLYAIPIFVVAPFLIEKIALNHNFPFTDTPIPISGFHSPDRIYNNKTSLQRLFDIIQHLILPISAITYGTLASQARLSRTAILEVLRQDYVRTAMAKGCSLRSILLKHVGRNAAITIVTSIAGSFGIVLGGSLIVETIFEINGFGKFFYEAIVNRDYNVIMFSALAGALLSLISYLIADITYTLLDPRVSLE